MNTPTWLLRISAIWIAIGSFLILLGAQGASLPSWLPDLFSQAFVDAVLVVVGAVINFYQFVRSIFVKTDAQIKTLAAENKAAYLFNPFKIAA